MIMQLLTLAESLMNYEPNDKFLHKLNPLTKMSFLVLVVVGGMYVSGPDFPWWLIGGMFVLLVLLSALGGIPLRKELQLRGVYVLVIVSILFFGNLIFSRGGEETTFYNLEDVTVYLSIPPFIYISSVSLNFAISKTLFILCSILVVILLLKSTRLSDLSHSMQSIGTPYPIAMLTTTALRCVPMVTDGLVTVYNALRARGQEMDKGSIKERIKQWGSLLTPLMLVLLKWVDLMSIVFQSRGLDFAARPRTRLRVVPFRVVDGVISFIVLGGMVAFIVLHATGILTFKVG